VTDASFVSFNEADQDAIRAQLARVLRSAALAQSQRRQKFLDYIVTETLAGRGSRLKGYTLAIEVFGRPASFDPGTDPLVRIEAARLRDKLRTYYRGAGKSDPIRIDLPKGRYTPRFEFRPAAFHGGWTEASDATEREGPLPDAAFPAWDDRPSVVVLPFVNMSGDAAHDYVADGITENIITGLSRFRDLSIIASYSSFAYKGKPRRIQSVAQELGVRFVLEGSIQALTDRVSVTAQLIDAVTGTHLWAERFDRGVDNLAAAIDEVTGLIVARLGNAYGGRLQKAWRGRPERTSPQNFRAFDHFQRGLAILDTHARGCTEAARSCFAQAIALDPAYGKPYAKMGWSHLTDVWLGWTDDPERSMKDALRCAHLALAHDDDEAWGHWALGGYQIFCGEHDRAVAAYERALELNPNDADVINDFGYCLSTAGRAQEGVGWVHKAMRLNPHFPEYWLMLQGQVYFDARQYEDAVSTLDSLNTIDTISVQLYLAASHAALGRLELARDAIARVKAFDPGANLRSCAPVTVDVYKEERDREHVRHFLLMAGLPE